MSLPTIFLLIAALIGAYLLICLISFILRSVMLNKKVITFFNVPKEPTNEKIDRLMIYIKDSKDNDLGDKKIINNLISDGEKKEDVYIAYQYLLKKYGIEIIPLSFQFFSPSRYNFFGSYLLRIRRLLYGFLGMVYNGSDPKNFLDRQVIFIRSNPIKSVIIAIFIILISIWLFGIFSNPSFVRFVHPSVYYK